MSDYITDFRQGDSKVIKIDYGTGVDITGWKFWFTMKTELDSTNITAQISTTAGDDTNDDIANGIAYITVDSVTSYGIAAGKYYYDVQVSKGGNPPVIKTILPPIEEYKDRINVIPGLTKTTIQIKKVK